MQVGGNLAGKAVALLFLASRCDGLVFIGNAAFQIMHAFGLPVTMELVEQESLEAARVLVEAAKARGVQIILPKDFWCINDYYPSRMKIFPANRIIDGKVKFLNLQPSPKVCIVSFARLRTKWTRDC